MTAQIERCPDCGVELPKPEYEGHTHPYIGASPSCWALFSALLNAGDPPMAPAPTNALLIDAYAAQHPGSPSPQAIQSVAVHLLALYGVLHLGVAPEYALWIRRRPLRERARGKSGSKHDRFHWLTPPDLASGLTVADIVQAPTPAARSETAQAYIEQVWSLWAEQHLSTLAQWYTMYVEAEEI